MLRWNFARSLSEVSLVGDLAIEVPQLWQRNSEMLLSQKCSAEQRSWSDGESNGCGKGA